MSTLAPVRPLHPVVIALLATIALAPAGADAASCKGADAVPSSRTLKRARVATLCLVNVARRRQGVGALADERRLAKAAVGHSRDMVARRYFEHETPEGRDPGDRIAAEGYAPSTWGENIAWGTGPLATPRAIVRSWMNSSGHRRNILDRAFRESGIGIALGAPDRRGKGLAGATYTHVFAARR